MNLTFHIKRLSRLDVFHSRVKVELLYLLKLVYIDRLINCSPI
jgi:hypothetical protein